MESCEGVGYAQSVHFSEGLRVSPDQSGILIEVTAYDALPLRLPWARLQEFARTAGASLVEGPRERKTDPLADLCHQFGLSEANFIGIGSAGLEHVRLLEQENQRLQRLVAELMLDRFRG